MNNNQENNILSQGASAAASVKSAVKAGIAIASISKGAAAGPYGAVAVGIWENRKLLLKILVVVICLLMLPLLFIMMLPSLVFSDLDKNILTDSSIIMNNIDTADLIISSTLQDSYNTVIENIKSRIETLDPEIQYEVVDEFQGKISYQSSLIISQYCVYKGNYSDISVEDFQSMISSAESDIFFYQENTEEHDRTETIEKKITYTVCYRGEQYFEQQLFSLSEEQKTLSAEYAKNLDIFLEDQFQPVQNSIHKSFSELSNLYPYQWTPGSFHAPFLDQNWKSSISSGYGFRKDPFTGEASGHNALDIAMAGGTPIHASKDGIAGRVAGGQAGQFELRAAGFHHRLIQINICGGAFGSAPPFSFFSVIQCICSGICTQNENNMLIAAIPFEQKYGFAQFFKWTILYCKKQCRGRTAS